jgi:hypothetical protein
VHRQYTILAILALSSITGCADDEEEIPGLPYVTGVYDRTADFSEYETFDIVEPEEVANDQTMPAALIEANRIAITNAIVDELEDRGYVRDEDSPHLKVTTFVRYREYEVVTERAYWQDYYYGWYWGYGYPWYNRNIVEYEAGTLIIDAVEVGEPEDETDDMLVFRGVAGAMLPERPVDLTDDIPVIVDEIFDYWPAT